jgi:hypothetical protein
LSIYYKYRYKKSSLDWIDAYFSLDTMWHHVITGDRDSRETCD